MDVKAPSSAVRIRGPIGEATDNLLGADCPDGAAAAGVFATGFLVANFFVVGFFVVGFFGADRCFESTWTSHSSPLPLVEVVARRN
jgi:hypothetical protein